MKTFKELTEAIKGWKNAQLDIAKSRSQAAQAGNNVKLVRLKKDGSESGMHNAASTYSSEQEARDKHENLKKLNPTSNIMHNLYVDGKLVEKLQ
jgi:hypothetical protein